MRILGVGIATLDVVNTVEAYPREDDEVRALAQRISRGGNATNTLVTLSQLGHDCAWAGMLSLDSAGDWVRKDLQSHSVDMSAVVSVEDSTMPTSYVTLNQQNGSRTIIHFRDMIEYSHEYFESIELADFDWIHFEGRNVASLSQMMYSLVERGFKRFSLEIEKPRENIEELLHLPELLMFSRIYVRDTHQGSAKDFFETLRDKGIHAPVYCGWGKAGGWAMDTAGHLFQQPAWQPDKVRDTLGAGDVFNAAVIDAFLKERQTSEVLEFACKVAGFKCGQEGFGRIAEVLQQ